MIQHHWVIRQLPVIAICLCITACNQASPDAWLTKQKYRITAVYNLTDIPQDASGLSYDPQRDGLWLVSDDPATLFFLNLEGQIVQKIDLVGFDDPEAITWIGTNKEGMSRLVLSEERRGRLIIVHVNADTQSIEYDNASLLVQLEKLGSNNGVEGLAYRASDASLWFATENHPQAVYQLDTSAEVVQVWDKPLLRYPWDYSGMTHIPQTDSMLVISDRSQMLIEYSVKGKELARLSLKEIPNPEGIAITVDGSIYICSEPNLLFKLSPIRTGSR